MKLPSLVVAAGLLMFSSFSVIADEGGAFNAKLTGFQETPSILTTGTGTFSSTLNSAGTELSYTLTYSGLSSNALVAHIHFAQRSVAGAIIVFLCNSPTKPACPAGGGAVSDKITAADVLAVSSQGFNAGSFADLLAALRSGDTYVNVHTVNHPGGEIRGQLRVSED